MHLRRPIVIVAAVALVVVIAAAAIVGFSRSSSARSQLSLLFTLSGEASTMIPVSGSTDRYTLAVTGVDPAVVWFTDRPARETGAATLDWFAAQWAPGAPFAADPPNAAMVVHVVADTTDTIVIELQSVSVDAAARTLTARVRVLGSLEADALSGVLDLYGQRHDPNAIPVRLGGITLFVDAETVGSSGGQWGGTVPRGTGGDGGSGGDGGLIFGNGGDGGAVGESDLILGTGGAGVPLPPPIEDLGALPN